MRKVLLVVAVGVLSLPLIFVLWLLAAVRMPKMDAFTMQMPANIRSVVAEAAVQEMKYGKNELQEIKRVIALDPKNASAWDRLCGLDRNQSPNRAGVKTCETALSLDGSSINWDNLGALQEKTGDECAAADAYTKATNKGSSGTYYGYVEDMGRASLRCGKNYDARAGLAAAIELEDKSMKEPDVDDADIADDKADQLEDREYLIVTLDRLHDAAGAKLACNTAHPDWNGCACKLDAKGEVACVEAGR